MNTTTVCLKYNYQNPYTFYRRWSLGLDGIHNIYFNKFTTIMPISEVLLPFIIPNSQIRFQI